MGRCIASRNNSPNVTGSAKPINTHARKRQNPGIDRSAGRRGGPGAGLHMDRDLGGIDCRHSVGLVLLPARQSLTLRSGASAKSEWSRSSASTGIARWIQPGRNSGEPRLVYWENKWPGLDPALSDGAAAGYGSANRGNE